MVEGYGTAPVDNAEQDSLYIGEHLSRWNTKGADTGLLEPLVAISVLPGAVSPFVRFTIYLDRQASGFAVEVEHIRTRGMLAAELEIAWPGSQCSPE